MCPAFLLHNTAHMSPRLLIALAVSVALHASLLATHLLTPHSAVVQSAALRAQLRPPTHPVATPAASEPPPAETLLKNTLADNDAPPVAKAPPPAVAKPATPTRASKDATRRDVSRAQRKLSEHLFYPPEALARGLEGEVRLLVRLTPDGRVDDVSVAASSSHAILDNAAIRAAYAMGALPGGPRELILPVVFQLQ